MVHTRVDVQKRVAIVPAGVTVGQSSVFRRQEILDATVGDVAGGRRDGGGLVGRKGRARCVVGHIEMVAQARAVGRVPDLFVESTRILVIAIELGTPGHALTRGHIRGRNDRQAKRNLFSKQKRRLRPETEKNTLTCPEMLVAHPEWRPSGAISAPPGPSHVLPVSGLS